MNTFKLQLLFNPFNVSNSSLPIKPKSKLCTTKTTNLALKSPSSEPPLVLSWKKHSRTAIVGVVSVGIAVLVMGFEDHKALALGPEGPLVEEFWDNMRRYGLYALTVSTGAIWALIQPIWELLQNPISAILIIIILGGGFFLVSQVVTAMVGLSDFSYDYSN